MQIFFFSLEKQVASNYGALLRKRTTVNIYFTTITKLIENNFPREESDEKARLEMSSSFTSHILFYAGYY